MVNIEIQTEQKAPSPARERSIFAIGYVRFKSAADAVNTDDEMQVLGVMVVKDTAEPNSAKNAGGC